MNQQSEFRCQRLTEPLPWAKAQWRSEHAQPLPSRNLQFIKDGLVEQVAVKNKEALTSLLWGVMCNEGCCLA